MSAFKGNKIISKNDKHYILMASNKNLLFKISSCDYEKCSNFTWRAFQKRKNGDYYIQTDMYINGVRKKVTLHRFIMDCKNGDNLIVDHKNRNTLDNTRENLRFATLSENQRNSKVQTNCSSGVAGVGFHKASGKWRARIVVDNKEIYLGIFDNFELACKARKNAEKKYFKEFASYEKNK